eukprot:TRINITY_DN12964_c0_g1_i1.p1 TRINITY_DN12964_c0_g1~~TRINITY_DN12964_c0_g1_i1.p1  ORF type:complete len:591 (-),score=135.34 TRINITY_DN12964_c0_g1_i1:14-1786(-)
MASEEDLRVYFEGNNLQLRPDDEPVIVAKCVQLCKDFGLSAETLALKWEAHLTNSKHIVKEITMEDFQAFSTALAAKQPQVVRKLRAVLPSSMRADTLAAPASLAVAPSLFEGFDYGAGGDDPMGFMPASDASAPSTADIPEDDSMDEGDAKGVTVHKQHTGVVTKIRGGFVTSFNSQLPEKITSSRSPVIVFEPEVAPYLCNYDPVPKKAEALSKRLERVGERFAQGLGVPFETNFSGISLEGAPVAAQVACLPPEEKDTATSKLTPYNVCAQGVVGEGSNWMRLMLVHGGDSVYYNLFPGQVVMLNGNVPDTMVRVTSIKTGPPAQLYKPVSSCKGFSMTVAVGPFTAQSDLDFTLLSALVDDVKANTPDILLLVGPFVNASHSELFNLEEDVEDLFRDQVSADCLQRLKGMEHLKIIVVPSLEDIVHPHFLFPQPPFPKHLFIAQDNVKLTSNPTTFRVDEAVTVGVSSVDVLKDLSANCIIKDKPEDRMATLCEHVLSQQSYYPLFPPETGVNMDAKHMEQIEFTGYSPHFIILASDLQPFVKVVQGTVFINPGRMPRSFARVVVHPSHGDPLAVRQNTRVDIVKV